MGLSLVSFVGLTLWYNQPELLYILHTIAQSVLGIFISWPMRWVFRRVWEVDLVLRLSISILSALVFAAIWAALQFWLFELIPVSLLVGQISAVGCFPQFLSLYVGWRCTTA